MRGAWFSVSLSIKMWGVWFSISLLWPQFHPAGRAAAGRSACKTAPGERRRRRRRRGRRWRRRGRRRRRRRRRGEERETSTETRRKLNKNKKRKCPLLIVIAIAIAEEFTNILNSKLCQNICVFHLLGVLLLRQGFPLLLSVKDCQACGWIMFYGF